MAAFFQAEQFRFYASRAERQSNEASQIVAIALVGVLGSIWLVAEGPRSPAIVGAVLSSLLPPLAILLSKGFYARGVSLCTMLVGLLASTYIVAFVTASAPWNALFWLAMATLETALALNSRSAAASSLFTGAMLILFVELERLGWTAFGVAGHVSMALAPSSAVCLAVLLRALWRRHGVGRVMTHEKSREYDALCEAVDDLVMQFDGNGYVVSASENASRLLKLDPEALKGTGLFNRIHIADRPAFLQAIDLARHGDQAEAVVARVRSGEVGKSANGGEEPKFAWMEIRFRRLSASGATPSKGGQPALVSAARNITKAKELEQRLESAQAESGMAVALKDRLLANISHELRTPLNAILGFSEMLGDTELAPTDPAKRTEYARIIHSSAEHLLSVVNLVLDMSRIEAGKFEIAPEPFEIEPLIRDCCDMLRLKAVSGAVTLTMLSLPDRLEIVADKRAFRQIVLNLVSNAVKFTPAGGQVTIGVSAAVSTVELCVSDTGIGIAAADLPRLGNPFFQVRSAYDRRFEGAGLGLSLVRGLVGLHAGSLLMESAEGIGTRVTVKLPLDCRGATHAGAGASRLETLPLTSLESNPMSEFMETSMRTIATGERKIA